MEENQHKHVRLGILPGGVNVALYPLFLQTAEERLCYHIFPTVSPATDAGLKLDALAPQTVVITAQLGG